jgi:hypothetical protein
MTAGGQDMTGSQGYGQAPPGRDRVGALAGLASVAAFLAGLRPVAVAAGAVAAGRAPPPTPSSPPR